MEIFRYETAARYDEIRQKGILAPYPFHGELVPVYALPEDPLIWGIDNTLELLLWITHHRNLQRPSILMRWKIPTSNNKAKIFVQESWIPEWDKSETRKHIAKYKRESYKNPEIVSWEPVPINEISFAKLPECLKNF